MVRRRQNVNFQRAFIGHPIEKKNANTLRNDIYSTRIKASTRFTPFRSVAFLTLKMAHPPLFPFQNGSPESKKKYELLYFLKQISELLKSYFEIIKQRWRDLLGTSPTVCSNFSSAARAVPSGSALRARLAPLSRSPGIKIPEMTG